MGQEMTICNTSIKLWGKNSVTRSIIAPKKNLIFSPTQIAKFSFMFYLLGVEHDGKKFGIVTISSFDNINFWRPDVFLAFGARFKNFV